MRKRLILLMVITLLVISVFNTATVFGASASFSVSGGGKYNVGDTVRITYTYSADSLGIAKTTLKYDSSILQYQSCSGGTAPTSAAGELPVLAGGDGTLLKTISVTVTFKALKTGSSTISFSHDEVLDYDGHSLSVSSKSTTVTVTNSSSSASGNANLASLSVSAGTLSPSFSASRTSYTVNVDNDVTVCTISATPADSGASISVSGSMYLSVGTNTRKVTVTAENGTTKTYTITIIRSGDGSSSEGTDTEDPNGGDAQNPAEDIKVTVGDKEYIVNDTFTENDFPTGFTMTIAQYGDHEIPVIKDNALKYTLALLTDPETGDSRWFFYDEETDTFSERVEMTADEAMEYASLLSDSGKPDGGEKGMTASDKILFAGLGATVAALAVAVMVLQVKILRRKKPRKAPQIPYSQDQDTPDDASHGSGTDQMGEDDNGETGHEKEEPDTDPGADN